MLSVENAINIAHALLDLMVTSTHGKEAGNNIELVGMTNSKLDTWKACKIFCSAI